MGKIRLSENEKELLNALGNHPDASIKELLAHTHYRWERTIIRKLKQLKEKGIYMGPFYDIHYDKLCKNPLHKVFCIVETDQTLKTVISYITFIESLIWVYPVLSPHKKLLNVGILSSNDTESKALFDILKDNTIITDYIFRPFTSKRVGENPHFFGSAAPSLDNLLAPCDIPAMAFECHQTEWNACDISILPHLRRGYKGGKIIDIMRKEKSLQKSWTYNQIKYSRQKMIKHKLIEKKYVINPFPLNKCVDFCLFMKSEDIKTMQKIVYNFAKNERVYREYVLCQDWGLISVVSHRSFLTDLMYKLDHIPEIVEKELYQIRSIPAGDYYFFPHLQLKYFDVDTQTLEYPYSLYKEILKEKIDESTL